MAGVDAGSHIADTPTVRILVGVLCAVTAAAVIFITLLILRREGRDLMVKYL